MNYPYFFVQEDIDKQETIVMDEATSRHIGQVLRMQEGEKITVTNGKGIKVLAELSTIQKKNCFAKTIRVERIPTPTIAATIAISLLKNINRFEWFLEKATELGVHEIVPLICHRTEKEKFRTERLQSICISAMLQSQQAWLPKLYEPQPFNNFIVSKKEGSLFVAHCMDGHKISLAKELKDASTQRTLLIGPEGDFTPQEIEIALQQYYKPVSLGDTRLRTETAGIIGATLLLLS